jgi:hypothetical protein
MSNATTHFLGKNQGSSVFFYLMDCSLEMSVQLEGPVIRHFDTGFLGFPLSSDKYRDASKLLLHVPHAGFHT